MISDFVNFSAQTSTDILKGGRAFDNTVGGVGQFVDSCQESSRPPTQRYPINFRKHQFCTDVYHLFQSTDKK